MSITNSLVTLTRNYLDTGLISRAIDACGHNSTFQYSPTPSLGAGAYLSTSCNHLGQCSNFTYDFNSGATTSAADPNSATTSQTYDNVGRLKSITYPDQGESDFYYPDAVTVEKKVVINRSQNLWADGFFYFDGLGGTTQTRLVASPCDSYVNTTYDAIGRVSTVSNPHCVTQGPTDGITTSVYDALGRVTQTTLQDGSISTIDYSQFPTVTVTDPANNKRQSRTDALGRIVEVDEPGDPAKFVANNYGNLALDGNFAVFGPANDIKWQTNTHGATNTFYSLNMQDDGNLIKYTPTWNTATPTTTGTASYGTLSCVGYRLFAGQTLASGACSAIPE